MAYTRNGVITGKRRNTVSLSVSAGIGADAKTFSPTYSISGKKGVQSNEYEVKYDGAGNDEGEPMKLMTFTGLGQKGLSTQIEDTKFLGICNTGGVSLEIFLKTTNYKASGEADIVCASFTDCVLNPYLSFILHSGEFISLPNIGLLIQNVNQTGTDAPEALGRGTEGTVALTGTGDGVSTDGTGFCETANWFGGTATSGLVPGSIAIQFYSAGYQEFGITRTINSGRRQTPSSDTGLTANTAYRFKATIDGVVNNIVFTTDATDVTWGNGVSGNGVLKKINDRFLAAWKAGPMVTQCKIHLVKGDVRITSGSRLNTSAVALGDSVTGSENQMFGTGGVISHESTLDSAVAAALETPTLLDRDPNSVNHLLLDNGRGGGSRIDGGIFNLIDTTGSNFYAASSCTLQMKNCPPYANFSIFYNYNAAHSYPPLGSVSPNILTDIYARCINKKADKGRVKIFSSNG